ncbi:MAG: PAS and helix-turn-helix domain-containing protein [Solirubrobacteraceae bacterium]|jgi:PAS domain S-box-containing protein
MQSDVRADSWREMFWRVFGASLTPMLLLDRDRRIVAVNDAMIANLGYPRQRMLDRRLDIFYDAVEWEYLEAWWRAFQRRPEFNGERKMVRADGDRVDMEYAAHWAEIDGRRLALFVAVHVSSQPRRHATTQLPTGEPLSRRELEVLGWVALGRRAHEIADELGIGSRTVESHVRNAMRKVGARSQAQLVAIACARGLVDLSTVS